MKQVTIYMACLDIIPGSNIRVYRKKDEAIADMKFYIGNSLGLLCPNDLKNFGLEFKAGEIRKFVLKEVPYGS